MDYTMAYIILSYFLIGAFAGTMSGLLGIGGGMVVVPGLVFMFAIMKMPSSIIMHMAIGTSLAVMVITTTRALMAHLRYRIKFWSIYRRIAPGVILGTIIGAFLAHFLHSQVLKIVFAVYVLLVALKMLLERKPNPRRQLPGPVGMSLTGVVIGTKSGLLGLGGGSISIPFLIFCNVAMRTAVVVTLAIGVTIAIVGSTSFAISGLYATGLPDWSTGYIHWPAWAFVAAGSLLFAPIGAKLSHRLPAPILKRVFALFLLLVAVQLLFYT